MSRGTRRQGIAILMLVAVIWRLVPLVRIVRAPGEASGELGESAVLAPFTGSGFDLVEFFLNPAIAWVGSPLYLLVASFETQLGTGGGWLLLMQTLLSIAFVFVVFGVAERLFGSGPAFVSGALCAVCDPLIRAGFVLAPFLLGAMLALLYARRLVEVGHRREEHAGLGLGVLAGFLVWVQAYLAWWAIASIVWLPLVSKRFRGASGARFAGLFALGWMLWQLPIVIHGAAVGDDLVVAWDNAAYDLRVAAEDGFVELGEHEGHIPYALGRRAQSIHRHESRHEGIAGPAHERWAEDVGAAFAAFGEDPAAAIGVGVQRLGRLGARAIDGPLLGRDPPIENLFRGLPLLPLRALLVMSWLGAFTLLPSLRSYAPVMVGLAIPFLVAVFTGASAGLQVAALPFQALLAGYGLSRVWSARGWPPTWILAPACAGAAWLWTGLF